MQSNRDFVQKLSFPQNTYRLFAFVLGIALIAGVGTGYVLASTSGKGKAGAPIIGGQAAPKSAQQDTQTFKDFAEGKITKKPDPKPGQNYTEGTHLLIRDNAVPVALTSSVVDLSQYEGKKVKVYGETQKAVAEGWLMDVGKVEVEQ